LRQWVLRAVADSPLSGALLITCYMLSLPRSHEAHEEELLHSVLFFVSSCLRGGISLPRLRLSFDRSLAQLRIDFIEIPFVDEDLARLAAGCGRNQSFHLHHVDEPGGTAEAD